MIHRVVYIVCELCRSYGKKPFQTLAVKKYIAEIQRGVRLQKPLGCPQPLYDVLLSCWRYDSSEVDCTQMHSDTHLHTHTQIHPESNLRALTLCPPHTHTESYRITQETSIGNVHTHTYVSR